MNHSLRLISLCALSTIALAACGSAHRNPSVASLSTTTHRQASPQAATLAVWKAAVTCAREHGMPDLPDPVMGANGQVKFPGFSQIPSPTPEVASACAAQIRAVRSITQPETETPADLVALVHVAACMRHHGFPGWPDPNQQGVFHIKSDSPGTATQYAHAVSACQSLFPPNGWHVIATPSGR